MTRKPKPRRPLSPEERAKIEERVLVMLAEALKTNYSVWTNRADYAEAFGMLMTIEVLGFLTATERQDWMRAMEDKVGVFEHFRKERATKEGAPAA